MSGYVEVLGANEAAVAVREFGWVGRCTVKDGYSDWRTGSGGIAWCVVLVMNCCDGRSEGYNPAAGAVTGKDPRVKLSLLGESLCVDICAAAVVGWYS